MRSSFFEMYRSFIFPLAIIINIGEAGPKPVKKKVPTTAIHFHAAVNTEKTSMFTSIIMPKVGMSKG